MWVFAWYDLRRSYQYRANVGSYHDRFGSFRDEFLDTILDSIIFGGSVEYEQFAASPDPTMFVEVDHGRERETGMTKFVFHMRNMVAHYARGDTVVKEI